MKIWGDNPKVFGIYGQHSLVGKVTKNDVVSSRRDEYKISGQAKDFQTVMKALQNVPDIRQEKVREISAKLEAGRYNVSARDISEKMIQLFRGQEE